MSRIKGLLVLQHAVGDHQHLPHAWGERDHLALAVFAQPLVETLDERIPRERRERREVEGAPQARVALFA